jgi:asparagine synthase (glutamine-hydrolysing)
VSGLGGVLALGGRRVDPASLVRLGSALAARGGRGTRRIVEPSLAFVHAALREPDGRRPELWRGGVWLAWDGRLDNREALDAALGQAAQHDLHRLALAYGRWGVGFLERIEGDFALALWDGQVHRLVLARDSMGVRPLFYAQAEGRVFWGSTLRAVRAASRAPADLPADLDDDWVAGYFAHAIPAGATPFRAVEAVPPGHAVVFENGACRSRAFWAPGLRARQTLPDDRAYEERFAELFVEAVRCRLADRGPVAAQLSGGLDSSSIVCVADRLIRDGHVPATELLTISSVYEQSRSSDERRFIRQVEERIGRRGLHVSERDGLAFTGLEEPAYDYPTAFECVKGREGRGPEAMRACGARALLSGFGGDHLVHSEFEAALPLADLAWSFDLRGFARGLRRWHAWDGSPYPALVGASLALAFLPALGRGMALRGRAPILSCLDADFARRTHLRERLRDTAAPGGRGLPSKQRQLEAVRAAIRAVSWMYDSGGWPFEWSHPFLHRPLVEFCLAVPSDQFLRPGETRSLHRRALRPWLPAGIAGRRDKRGPDEALLRDLAAGWERVRPLLEGAEIVRRGFVDPGALRRAFDEARFGRFGSDLLFLLKAIALEAWLRGQQVLSPGKEVDCLFEHG